MKIKYLTISDGNYFNYVKVLADSLLELGCSEIFWGHIDGDHIHLKLIASNQIFLVKPNLVRVNSENSVVEICTKFRPLLLEHVFDLTNCDVGCYIDPDIYVYSDLEELLDSGATVWLTPHLIADDVISSNSYYLHKNATSQAHLLQRWGAFNMGIYFVRNNSEGRRFLKCYQSFLDKSCSTKSLYGYVDQKWMDVLASLFWGQITVISHPGINLSYWNLPFRELEYNDGKYSVNKKSLKAIHFSGVGVRGINCDYGSGSSIKTLISSYQARLNECNIQLPSSAALASKKSFKKILIHFARNLMFYFLEKTEAR